MYVCMYVCKCGSVWWATYRFFACEFPLNVCDGNLVCVLEHVYVAVRVRQTQSRQPASVLTVFAGQIRQLQLQLHRRQVVIAIITCIHTYIHRYRIVLV